MRRGYAALALLALIWGASFLFIKLAVRDMSPATMVLSRAIFGGYPPRHGGRAESMCRISR
jgi:drug/metabolite transporter (DMT)-like permease